ncbi:hypothetical protein AHF37_05395 [Paragonimus kellicotti]|nr:hypothetical protein AHF37_05395 [Paragonimus kellicotti]
MKLSQFDRTEDNDNTSLTLVPTVTTSQLSYSQNLSPSTLSSLNVDLVQSTDEIFTLSSLKDVCNSNYAECIVPQCTPQQPNNHFYPVRRRFGQKVYNGRPMNSLSFSLMFPVA